MGLNGYKHRCSKTVGGVSAVEMVAAREISTAEYNHKQGSYSRLIIKPDAVRVRYEFAEDSASYSEKLSREKGVVKVVHTLSFLLRGVGQQQRDAITELTKESRSGVVAVVTTASGEKLLVGYSEKFGVEQPLRLSTAERATGLRPEDSAGERVTLVSVDSQKALCIAE